MFRRFYYVKQFSLFYGNTQVLWVPRFFSSLCRNNMIVLDLWKIPVQKCNVDNNCLNHHLMY